MTEQPWDTFPRSSRGKPPGSIVGTTSDIAAHPRLPSIDVRPPYEPLSTLTTQPVEKTGDNLRETP